MLPIQCLLGFHYNRLCQAQSIQCEDSDLLGREDGELFKFDAQSNV